MFRASRPRLAARRPGRPRGPLLALLALVVALATLGAPAPLRAQTDPSVVSVTDLVGRTVALTAPVRRVLLGEARLLYLVSLLEKDDPFRTIVGMPNDLRTADFDSYAKYLERFPQLAGIPEMGTISSGAFSAEQAIALGPDVLILSYDTYVPARDSGLIATLERVGIPSVVVDFRQQPLENTVPSTLLLGRLLDRQAEAQRFVDYYLRQVNLVYSRVDALPARPEVFLYRAPGLLECCATFGRANLGALVERAGGANLGSGRVPGWAGTLSPEQVLTSDPPVIIATGSNWTYSPSRQQGIDYVSLGYGADPEQARAQLARLTDQPGWSGLRAVREGRVHAVWHQFYNSPYHFAVLQQFAKWLHPDAFADLDPERTLRELHAELLPISYSGAFWVSLAE